MQTIYYPPSLSLAMTVGIAACVPGVDRWCKARQWGSKTLGPHILVSLMDRRESRANDATVLALLAAAASPTDTNQKI